MQVEILSGSPRKKGNTSVLCNHLHSLLTEAGVQSSITHLYDYKIKPCIDCRACKQNAMLCKLNDEAGQIYRNLDTADVLVVGTPIYWFAPTAQTKLFIDRLRPYFVNKKLQGKRCALILPAGSGEKDCHLTIDMFTRISAALGMTFQGAVCVQAYDIGDVLQDNQSLEKIRLLAIQLLQCI